MNDQHDFERLVADSVRSIGPLSPSEGAHELTSQRVRQSRQDPEWLALIKESPMRTTSGPAVGSPTARLMAILAATLLLALALAAAGAGAQRLFAAGPIVVAQDGSGDFTDINDAVASASDGDEIRVRPGTYVGSVRIDKDITLAGDGDPAEIILDHTVDSPTVQGPAELGYTELPYGLLLEGSDASIRDMTLLARGVAVAVDGGAPTIENLLIDDPVETDASGEPVGPEPDLWESGAIVVDGGASPIVSRLATNGWIYVGAATLDLTDSEIANYLYLGDGSDSKVQGNVLAHLSVWRASVTTLVEDNDFAGSPWPDEAAKAIDLAITDGSRVTIAGNRIGDPSYVMAVRVSGGGEVDVRDNIIHDSGNGVRLDTGSRADLRVEGNDVSGNDWGIVIAEHTGSATVVDNTVTGNGTGLFLNGSTPTDFQGNRVCDNSTNVLLAVGAPAPDPDGNEICEEDAVG